MKFSQINLNTTMPLVGGYKPLSEDTTSLLLWRNIFNISHIEIFLFCCLLFPDPHGIFIHKIFICSDTSIYLRISQCIYRMKRQEKKKKPNALWVPTQVRWRNCFPFSKEKLTNLPPFRGIFQMPITTGVSKPFLLSRW